MFAFFYSDIVDRFLWIQNTWEKAQEFEERLQEYQDDQLRVLSDLVNEQLNLAD